MAGKSLFHFVLIIVFALLVSRTAVVFSQARARLKLASFNQPFCAPKLWWTAAEQGNQITLLHRGRYGLGL
jgi:hypothetical protein